MGSYRAPAGAAGLDRVEKTLGIKKKSATVSIATDAVTTDISNFIPAGASVLAIKVEVTTTIAGGHLTLIGVDGDADMFGQQAGSWSLENDGDILVTGGSTAGTRGNWFAAADTLRLTALGDGGPETYPTAGAVNVTMLYVDGASL